MELDLASFRDLRWLDDDDETGYQADDNAGQLAETNTQQHLVREQQQQHPQQQSQKKQRRDDQPHHPSSHIHKGKHKAKAAATSSKPPPTREHAPAPQQQQHQWDELTLDPEDALKLKVVIQATAPALLHFRKGARQVPFRDMVPRDAALINPPVPAQEDSNQHPVKPVWPTPERIERLKTIAIIQLPRDLESEADQADGIEQDSFASLSDALEAALATTDSQQRDAAAQADESREEEDFVRLRNVIMRRLLRNPSQPSAFPMTDAAGRALPSIRHKDFRIVSQPAPLKTEDESIVNGDQTSPAPSGTAALTPITLSRADNALTTLWTQTWFSEVLRGSTLALALLNELAERKRSKPDTITRALAVSAGGDDEGLDAMRSPSRKRARLDYDGRTHTLVQHPPKVALHMRLGTHGDLFTNAADMPRKYWERQRAVAVGQFAAEGAEDEEQTDDDDEGGDEDEEVGGIRLRRRAPGRKGQYAGSGSGTHANSSLAASAAAVEAAIQAVKRGRPKGSGKGMGKGWRKGRTKALEESEEVNRVEDRRKDRWAMGDVELGPASLIAITPARAFDARSSSNQGRAPLLGERFRIGGPAPDLGAFATTKSVAEQPLPSTLSPNATGASSLGKRFPGRLADFLYYNQYSSFAPVYDTSRASKSGAATTALWWYGRQNENRIKRFHQDSVRAAFAPGDGNEEAEILTIPEPPPVAPGVSIEAPTILLDEEGMQTAFSQLTQGHLITSASTEDTALDPELLRATYLQLSGQRTSAVSVDLCDAEQHDDDGEDLGDDEKAEAVLRQNQYLLQALVVLQGQRLLASVQEAEDQSAKPSLKRSRAPSKAGEASPVERLIAQELLSSLTALVALRPQLSTGTKSKSSSLIPTVSTLRAAATSALVPAEEPSFWGTIPTSQYQQSLAPLFIDQIHREPPRHGPLVVRDNLAALLTQGPPRHDVASGSVDAAAPRQSPAGPYAGYPPATNLIGDGGNAFGAGQGYGHSPAALASYPAGVQQLPVAAAAAHPTSHVPNASYGSPLASANATTGRPGAAVVGHSPYNASYTPQQTQQRNAIPGGPSTRGHQGYPQRPQY
ncbi:hypothetical protein OC861_005603 [Tilletia horrida]|nr:hypothetical protein OC861_005603 [Tilletia horrida]